VKVRDLRTIRAKAKRLKVLRTEVLDKAIRIHRDLAAPISAWLLIARDAGWESLNSLRQTLHRTDCVEGKTIFNIKGNRYRLIAIVNYASQTIFVKALITHAEYSKGNWKR
jgi:mRNA interferase HigB